MHAYDYGRSRGDELRAEAAHYRLARVGTAQRRRGIVRRRIAHAVMAFGRLVTAFGHALAMPEDSVVGQA